MADHTIVGVTFDEPQPRDAIHIAVAPVVAAEQLYAGQHIGLTGLDLECVSTKVRNTIGIVDPFLTRRVEVGERFWMFLYPNTITGLKHVWTHPAFVPETMIVQRDQDVSEKWLRSYCAREYMNYDILLSSAEDYNGNKEYLHISGSDAHGSIPPELWDHLETILGRKFTQRATYFSCSC